MNLDKYISENVHECNEIEDNNNINYFLLSI